MADIPVGIGIHRRFPGIVVTGKRPLSCQLASASLQLRLRDIIGGDILESPRLGKALLIRQDPPIQLEEIYEAWVLTSRQLT